MPRIRVVTDSTCDIPDALLRQFDVTVAPLSVQVGLDMYQDKGDLSSEQFLKRKASSSISPQIHAPSIEELSRLYRSMRESCDGVISIHVSSKLSNTFANASIAREAFGPIGQGGPFPVVVIDSLSISMGLGWLALAVARAALSGVDLPRLAALATRLSGLTHVAFFTDQLDGLFRNSSATRLSSQWESLAAQKPLFHLDEGQLAVYERTRTRAKARDAL
ncbi:MAG: DegV family EDD domain-containing protein, partial [Chloroflexi bacterium]|nr:DegV family EDD domain-containing protein [Chloroflexota bacterium]